MLTGLIPFSAILIAAMALIYMAIRNFINPQYRKYLLLLVVLAPAIIIAQAINQQQKIQFLKNGFANQPIETEADGYIGSDKCQYCHQDNHASWYSSYHRTMTQQASAESVLGDFKGVDLRVDDDEYHLSEQDGRFFVSMTVARPDDAESISTTTREIVLTTGSHHYQVYWYPAGNGRILAQLPLVYLINEETWVPRKAAFIQPPDTLATDEYSRWNTTCIRCHSTHGRPSPYFQNGEEFLDTRVAEFGISCEACHGPGAEHASLNTNPLRRYYYHLSSANDPSIVNPARLSAAESMQVCGQCHSVSTHKSQDTELAWRDNGSDFRPGGNLHDSRTIQTREEVEQDAADGSISSTKYWPDGVIRIAGRQYNALLYSPCIVSEEYSCLTCHSLHQSEDDQRDSKEWANDLLKPDAFGNKPCLQCHQQFEGETALTQHTHHEVGSSGSTCYNCHMPPTTYGLLGAIRSHQITSPDAASSKHSGRPNACNLCHMDRSLAWTAESLSAWYQLPEPSLTDQERNISASILWLLQGDAAQRAVINSSMKFEHVKQVAGTEWMPPYLANSLADPYAVNRMIALKTLKTLPGFEDVTFELNENAQDIARQQEQILSIWNELYSGEIGSRGELLIMDGKLDRASVDALMELQDQSRVFIAE